MGMCLCVRLLYISCIIINLTSVVNGVCVCGGGGLVCCRCYQEWYIIDMVDLQFMFPDVIRIVEI